MLVNTQSFWIRPSAKSVLKHLGALLIFGMAFAFLTFPVSFSPDSLILGRPFEDAFEYVFYLEWYRQAIFNLKVSPLFQPDIFYPTGWDMRFVAFPPLYPLVLSPVTQVFGPVFTYNMSLLITCVLAAYGVFLAARALKANWWAAVFSGIAYAFYPHREAYLGGHLNFLFASLGLPWMIYGLIRAAQPGNRQTYWAALAGLSLGLSIAGTWQYTLIGGITLVLFLGGTLLKDRKKWSKKRVGMIVAFTLAWAIVCIPILLGAWDALSSRQALGENAAFTFQGVDGTSVNIERLLVPSALNPLWYKFARETFPLRNGISGVVNFGYTAISLAAYGFGKTKQSEKIGFAWLIGGGIILSPATLFDRRLARLNGLGEKRKEALAGLLKK